MVRERKTRIRDIEKLHELIDSASLPKEKSLSTCEKEKIETLRKRLSEDITDDRKQRASAQAFPAGSDTLSPRVIIREKEGPQNKEEKVIQIDLGPKDIKKEKEPHLVSFIPVKDDPFVREPLFEIEKVPVAHKEVLVIQPSKEPTKSETGKRHLSAIFVRKGKERHHPTTQPMTTNASTSLEEPSGRTVGKEDHVFSRIKQPIEEKQTRPLIFPEETDRDIPAFEPVEFTATAPEKTEPKPLVGTISREEEKKQQKSAERQERLERKEQKREEKRFAREHKKIAIRGTVETEQEERKRKELQSRQSVAMAEEKKQEEQHLLKERKEKSRLENQELLEKQKQGRKKKKIEERQARIELKEKKREAKRLAKEHDRKLKLEWLEFQHAQRKNQKTKQLEEKKAAAKAKQKEQEEQRLLKERERNLRFEQVAAAKKEKEASKQKKIEEKQAKLKAKQEEHEARQRAKEQKQEVKMKQAQALRIEQEEAKQKELKEKAAAAKAKQKEEDTQRRAKEREEKARLKLSENPKETEKQKTRSMKKEKKAPAPPSTVDRKKAPEKHTGLLRAQVKQEKKSTRVISVQKEVPTRIKTERSDEETHEDKGSSFSIFSRKRHQADAQKSMTDLRKQEEKRLAKEQKEKARQERLEEKKRQKEEKIKRKLEEKQRTSVLNETRNDKERIKQKKLEEKHAKREERQKVREAKQLVIQEKKKKDYAFALKEKRLKEKEKKEQQMKQVEEKKERTQISLLGVGKAKDAGLSDERKRAERQKNTMELVRIAAEEKELRKTKAFERKMEKERKKKEREEQKFRMKEEEKAKKRMDVHMKEELLKEKLTKHPERTDPFVAFDSINEETAMLLGSVGYTSVEKLRQATVKDLVKIGLKKKIAQRIIAECGEFVEWEVLDATDHF